jgi:polyisoprenoid-binding protein YceI
MTGSISSWLFAALHAVSSIAHAAEPFPIDNRHSTIAFTIGIAGGLGSVDGAFEKYQGEIQYDPETPAKSSVSLTIDAASIDTGIAGRDEHLRSADFFDVQKFPTITFQSTEVLSEGDRYVLVGPLTMHGITKVVRIPFRRTHAAPTVTLFGTPSILFEGSLKIDRKEFGIEGTDRWNSIVEATAAMAMSREVEIRLRIIGQKPRAK